MKLGIVIPLKARVVSKDWGVTCENLMATLKSVQRQRSRNFECVVVGHDAPDFFSDNDFSSIQFKTYSRFPPPIKGSVESENQLKYEFDRCNKILDGIIFLKNKFPDITHWFALDADDLMSSEFVECIEKDGNNDVFIIDNGYFYFKSTGIVNEESEFSAYCGSSSVVADHLICLPIEMDRESYRCTPFGDISHVHMKDQMLKKGYSVFVPEKRLMMYVRDNGENISNDAYCNTFIKKFKKFVKMLIRYKRLDQKIYDDFGLAG